MASTHADPAALGFTVIAVSIALEETLKALAEKKRQSARPVARRSARHSTPARSSAS